MEQGSFTLDDGARIEASCFSASGASSFAAVTFDQALETTPVLMASVVTENEQDAVASRVRNISTSGFEFMMREQESNATDHATETACYIAWEPSLGTLDGMNYEVVRTPDAVTHAAYPVSFGQAFSETPMLLAAMQSTDGADTSTTGITANTAVGCSLYIGEEQSRDSETSHTTETVGYIAVGPYDPQADLDNDGLTVEEERETYMTDPTLADSDGDGIDDGEEVTYWLERNIDWAADLDNDGTSNLLDMDADGDGMNDGAEIAAGTDPADAASNESFPVMEAGAIDVDHNLVHVAFGRTFAAPVVIARLVSRNDAEPCVVRISAITATGFDIRLQEYKYLDNIHPVEQVSYIVMEAGHYTLADGTRLEAGSRTIQETSAYDSVAFNNTFSTTPVVVGTVAGENDQDPVVARIRSVSTNGFECKLQEEALTKTAHLPEQVNYLAWEPSSGTDNGLHYEVAATGDVLTHNAMGVSLGDGFDAAPLVFADMQSTDGGDTAALRTLQVSATELQILVEEEQSKDSEINHTTEAAGFIAIQAR
jgi:hypothetical protein